MKTKSVAMQKARETKDLSDGIIYSFSLKEACRRISFFSRTTEFIAWLKQNKMLQQNGMPYKKYLDKKLFILGEDPKDSTPVVRVTLDGLFYIFKMLFKELDKEL